MIDENIITKELLSLIADEKIERFALDIDTNKNALDSCLVVGCTGHDTEDCYDINLDTIIRLIEAFIIKQGYTILFATFSLDSHQVELYKNKSELQYSLFKNKCTKLEIMVEVLEWVAGKLEKRKEIK